MGHLSKLMWIKVNYIKIKQTTFTVWNKFFKFNNIWPKDMLLIFWKSNNYQWVSNSWLLSCGDLAIRQVAITKYTDTAEHIIWQWKIAKTKQKTKKTLYIKLKQPIAERQS